MKKNKKIFLVISNSLGELDVILPILNELKYKIKIVFTVRSIFKLYNKNIFYKNTLNSMKAKILFCKMESKFDNDYALKYKIFKIVLILKRYYYYFNFLIKNTDILSYNIFLHETSNQKYSTYILRLICKLFKKKLIVYHHGHSFNQQAKKIINVNDSNYSDYLFACFTKYNIEWAKSIGFKNAKVIGFPGFYKNWVTYVKKYASINFNKKNYVLIFSRKPKHEFYMDEEKYIEMLDDCFDVLRSKMKDKKIFIKLHPREINYSENIINNLIKKKKYSNIFIVDENSYILANNADLVISFWTSAILFALAQSSPAIEYYKEAKRFREAEPKGSLYKLFGIKSADNKNELINFIEDVEKKNYKDPDIIKELILEKNLNIFYEN